MEILEDTSIAMGNRWGGSGAKSCFDISVFTAKKFRIRSRIIGDVGLSRLVRASFTRKIRFQPFPVSSLNALVRQYRPTIPDIQTISSTLPDISPRLPRRHLSSCYCYCYASSPLSLSPSVSQLESRYPFNYCRLVGSEKRHGERIKR